MIKKRIFVHSGCLPEPELVLLHSFLRLTYVLWSGTCVTRDRRRSASLQLQSVQGNKDLELEIGQLLYVHVYTEVPDPFHRLRKGKDIRSLSKEKVACSTIESLP